MDGTDKVQVNEPNSAGGAAMEHLNANDIIGERKLYLEGKALSEPELVVSVGRPVRDESGYYRCAYQFSSVTEVRLGSTMGVDALDSVVRALALIGTELVGLNEAIYNGRLRWEAGEPGDFGLPTIEDHWPFKSRSPRN